MFPKHDRENLQFGKLVLDCEHTSSFVTQSRQIDVDLMRKLRKQMEIVEAPWLRAGPWVSSYGFKSFLCISLNTFGVLLFTLFITNWLRILGNIFPTTKRHRKIARLYKIMLVSTRQNKEKNISTFFVLNFYNTATPARHQAKCTYLVLYNTSWPKNCFFESRSWKRKNCVA